MSLRDYITFEYPLQDGPIWSCRACGTGRVTLTTTQVLIHETPTSIGGRLGDGTWDPALTTERFVAFALCDSCEDPTSMAGDTHTRPTVEANADRGWTTYLAPRYVYPPPLLVGRPKCLPTSIEDVLTSAEGLVWTDLDSAGRAIRHVIEEILDDRGIGVGTFVERSGVKLSLRERLIDLDPGGNEGGGDKRFAVGCVEGIVDPNRASLTLSDLDDGFDLIRNLFEDLYEQYP